MKSRVPLVFADPGFNLGFIINYAVLTFSVVLLENIHPNILLHLIGLCLWDAFHELSGHDSCPIFMVTVKRKKIQKIGPPKSNFFQKSDQAVTKNGHPLIYHTQVRGLQQTTCNDIVACKPQRAPPRVSR